MRLSNVKAQCSPTDFQVELENPYLKSSASCRNNLRKENNTERLGMHSDPYPHQGRQGQVRTGAELRNECVVVGLMTLCCNTKILSDKPRTYLNCYNQQGLSLIELLIAIAIITVVFLVMPMGQISSFTGLDKSVERKDAKTFAYRILEDKYQELIFDVLNTRAPNTPKDKFNEYLACQKGVSGCFGADSYENYTASWQLTSEQAADSAASVDKEGLVLLEVQVNWEEKGKKHSFGLANYLSCVYIVNSDGSTVCPIPIIPEGHE